MASELILGCRLVLVVTTSFSVLVFGFSSELWELSSLRINVDEFLLSWSVFVSGRIDEKLVSLAFFLEIFFEALIRNLPS